MTFKRCICTFIILTGAGVAGRPADGQTPPVPADNLPPAMANGSDASAILDQLDKSSAEKAHVEKEAVALNASRSQTRAALRSQTRALYRIMRAGIFPLTGGVESIITRMARVERLKHSVRADIERLRQLDKQAALVGQQDAALAASLERARTRLAELQQRALALPGEPGAEPNVGAATIRTASCNGQ